MNVGGTEAARRRNTMKKSSEKHEKPRRKGNVFAQLGLPDADDRLRKARVMAVINDIVRRRGLTQEAAAEIAGIDQADISRISHGRASRFSLDRLLTIVDRFGVPIAFEQRRDEHGNLIVEVRELAHA
jgi:predicted XRE-type DNA-binding protein